MKTRYEIEGIARRKKRLRTSLIFLAIFAVLLGVAITLAIVLGDNGEGEGGATPPEILEGEALYNNTYTIAYPLLEEKDIQSISVLNKTGSYVMLRDESIDNEFLISYRDSKGNTQIFYPDICSEDPAFKYSDLYAIELNDGFGKIPKISYLCNALQVAYFGERIMLSSDNAERAIQLREYGLNPEDVQTVSFTYKDADGSIKSHKIEIGDRTYSNMGYYFRVDDREMVYNSTSNYYDYALLGFYSFVNAKLVAAGLEEDSSYEPYLTTKYTQWVNQTYDNEGDVVTSDSSAVVLADVLVPISPYDAENYFGDSDGYINSVGQSKIKLDLSDARYENVAKALVGRTIGKQDISVTITSEYNSSKNITFGESGSATYEYVIVAIESFIKDGIETTEVGASCADADEVKVRYYFTVDGKDYSLLPSHAVISLDNESIPESARAALRASHIGVDPSEDADFTITYTPENSKSYQMDWKLVEIVSIYDKEGQSVAKIAEDSTVVYRYVLLINGVAGEEQYTEAIDLSAATSERDLAIKTKLVGRTVSRGLSIFYHTETLYGEFIKDFETYRISAIEYFIKSTEIVSFRFQNNSERDPYYGDSIYENLTKTDFRLYGLNSENCEHVVKILGGIGETSGVSEGLSGVETVAVGLTPENMEKYHLYNGKDGSQSYTVYFELPRGIIVLDTGANDEIDDYTWYDTLGFTLYISEKQPDGSRYVASDMYDVIAKVENPDLDYLERTYVDFWARDNLVMTDIKNVESYKLELFTKGHTGSYLFELDTDIAYLLPNGQAVITPNPPENYYDTHDYITVNVTPLSGASESALGTYITNKGYTSVSLEELYIQVAGGGKDNRKNVDSEGTSNFKEMIRILYLTNHEGSVSKEEVSEVIASAPMLMRLSFKLHDDYTYVFEFYRISDRRVLTKIYQVNDLGELKLGPVSDYYVSTFAFQKIVNANLNLLNAKEVDTEMTYPE